MDINQLAETVDSMAQRLKDAAKELEKVATQMRESEDPTLASEAMCVISNVVPNLRLDLLVTRSLRAAGKA